MMGSVTRSVGYKLGELSSGQRSLNARMKIVERDLGRIASFTDTLKGKIDSGQIALVVQDPRSFRAKPAGKGNGNGDAVAALSDEDKAALKEGRVWRGISATLDTARKNVLAVVVVVIAVVVGWQQIRGAKANANDVAQEIRKALAAELHFVGPKSPAVPIPGPRTRPTE